MIINLFNIVLKVNIQTNKHFDANEYFIAIGIIYNVYIHEWPEGTSILTFIAHVLNKCVLILSTLDNTFI